MCVIYADKWILDECKRSLQPFGWRQQPHPIETWTRTLTATRRTGTSHLCLYSTSPMLSLSLIALNGSSFDRKIISNKRSTDRMSSMSIRSRSTLTCLHLLFLVRSLFNRWLSSWFNEHQRYSINEHWSTSIINWWWTSILDQKKTMASGDEAKEEEEEDLARW